MRNFIISDIHGNGNLYYSIMNYLDNISKNDNVTLYINGDLIDRGIDSGKILLDLYNRINGNNSFKIVYLAGNHELLLYKIFERRRKNQFVTKYNDWYLNGGKVTDDYLTNEINDKDKILELVDFISNLDLYHKFNNKLDNKNILLAHACAPSKVKDECDLKIKDTSLFNEYILWTRKEDSFIPFRSRIGDKEHFSIVGHTPNNNKFGYFYDKNENYLNIDGGSAGYVIGELTYNHFPLVEIEDNYLKILTFNSGNEIIYGNYFDNYESIPFSSEELNNERQKLLTK